MIRKNALSRAEFETEFGVEPEEARQLIEQLIERGLALTATREADQATVYRVRLARTKSLGAP